MNKRNKQMIDARRKRDERAVAHAAMMAKHEARREAIAVYNRAMNAWEDARYAGPAPLDPRFYDLALFPENKPA